MRTTPVANKAKTHCKRGHELSPENIKKLSDKSAGRRCKICHRAHDAKLRAIRKRPRATAEERFFKKVKITPSCWIWTGAGMGGDDARYGAFRWGVKNGYAHRFAFEMAKGPIPKGLHIDHLCRNPRCVNPAHLDAVTCRVNVLRGIGDSAVNSVKTHCQRGHEFTPENTYFQPGLNRRKRSCKACKVEYMRRYFKERLAPMKRASRIKQPMD